MTDTTADEGSVDAVAASLIDGPQEDNEQDEILEQPDEGDASIQMDADDAVSDDDTANDDEDEGADESEADADEVAPAERLFTVKVDGREQQVPLNELLRGYSGQAYIQRGMQEVADARQQITAASETFAQERQQFLQFAQAAQSGQLPMRPPEPPNRDLLTRDPIGYMEARLQYDEDVAAFGNVQRAMQEINARQAQAEEAAHHARLSEEQQRLSQAIPAFAKPETAAQAKKDLLAAGQDVYGFNLDELRSVADHRMLRVLHDAAQYRRLMAGKGASAQASLAPKTPVVKPGVRATNQTGARVKGEKAKVQMKRTGSVDDVARFLLM